MKSPPSVTTTSGPLAIGERHRWRAGRRDPAAERDACCAGAGIRCRLLTLANLLALRAGLAAHRRCRRP